MVSGHPKSTGIPQVDGLSMGPPNLGCYSELEISGILLTVDLWVMDI